MTHSGPSKRSRKQLKETNNKVVLFWRKLKKNVFVAFFLDVFVIIGSALLLSLVIKTFLIRSFFIPSGSMLETLRIDDRIVVNELVPSLIAVERGKLSINGTPITETYLAKGTNPSFKDFDVTVPEGSYWMMGDNRSDSEDSRYHTDLPSKGFVAQKFIVGKAFVITWPTKHWTWLGNYPDVFKDVPNK